MTSSRGSTPDHGSWGATSRGELISVGMVGRMKRSSLWVGAQLRLQGCRLLCQLSPTKKKSTPDQIRSSLPNATRQQRVKQLPMGLGSSQKTAVPGKTVGLDQTSVAHVCVPPWRLFRAAGKRTASTATLSPELYCLFESRWTLPASCQS